MANDVFSYDEATADTAFGSLGSVASGLQGNLDDLTGFVNRVRANWEGDEMDLYDSIQQRWNSASVTIEGSFGRSERAGRTRGRRPRLDAAVGPGAMLPEFWRSWGELVPSIRTGTTGWELAHKVSWLEYYRQHPEDWTMFNSHMSQHTRDAAPAIAAALDFSRFHTVVDIGGGDGTLIAEILRTHRRLQGVVFDQPEVLATLGATLATAGVADRARADPGDFFVSVTRGADAYLMKFIRHDWDDERAVAILRNCREAMTPGGRVLIVERVLPEQVTAAEVPDLLSDILMLVATGGKERTEKEYRDLLAAAGFDLTSVTEPLPPFNYRVIEASSVPAR